MSQNKQAPDRGAPERFLKGRRTFAVDTFELKPAMRKHNTSWIPDKPRIEEQQHKHFFRSKDDKGNDNNRATYQADHTHEITVDWSKKGPDGGPLVKCGPPIKKGFKTLPSGRKAKSLNPVKWIIETVRGEVADVMEVVDNHTHDITYLGTQILQERGAPKLSDDSIAEQFGLRPPSTNIAGVNISE